MTHEVTTPDVRSIGGGRRLALFGLLVLASLLGVVALASAVWPTDGPGVPERWIEAGAVDGYPPGTVTTLPVDTADPTMPPALHVVHLADGELLVISGRDPMGCAIPWRPSFDFDGRQGWFRDPCRGSTYDVQGRRVAGPSLRDLDRMQFEVTGRGTLRIEVAHPAQAPVGGWR